MGRNKPFVSDRGCGSVTPVGLDISPALDRRELEAAYNFKVTEVALTDIMRQAEQSGILYNATQVRSLIGTDRKICGSGSENFPMFLRSVVGNFWKK